ncbi:hypothetical protein QMO56_03460 [Roseomonas sp. E05]|uniref:hypothetical protein n=1 Tax=Roseomonas sp. E05 TaxID=3046310 RepID=UPI0024BA124F|nr:hypothetical protein [Roseomonas sp. E05]MDJ0387162.1 hypothetical protein [Roseomonas sp. E05]
MALDSFAAAGPLSAASLSARPVPPGGLLAAGRLLGGADALFELVQRLLSTIAGRVCGAQTHLEALARAGTPAEDWAEALLRYRQVADDIRASLVAVREIGQALLEAGLEDGFGLADSLDLLERIAVYLPPVPPDVEAAQDGLAALGEMTAAIAAAQMRFTAGHSRVAARLALSLDEPALEPAPLEGTDLQKEAVRLQALQVRQQLAGHALGLGALVPRCLRDLDET